RLGLRARWTPLSRRNPSDVLSVGPAPPPRSLGRTRGISPGALGCGPEDRAMGLLPFRRWFPHLHGTVDEPAGTASRALNHPAALSSTLATGLHRRTTPAHHPGSEGRSTRDDGGHRAGRHIARNARPRITAAETARSPSGSRWRSRPAGRRFC